MPTFSASPVGALEARRPAIHFDRWRNVNHDATMEALVRATSDAVRAYIGAIGIAVDAVDDVAQEAYLRYFSQPERRPPNVAEIAWLKGIARHCALEHLRRLPRTGLLLADLAEVLDRHGESVVESDADVALPALRTCLAALSQRHREILHLTYAEGLNGRVLAERLRTSLGTIQVTLHRLRCALRDCLRRNLTGEPA